MFLHRREQIRYHTVPSPELCLSAISLRIACRLNHHAVAIITIAPNKKDVNIFTTLTLRPQITPAYAASHPLSPRRLAAKTPSGSPHKMDTANNPTKVPLKHFACFNDIRLSAPPKLADGLGLRLQPRVQ
jgi:hypothetical protein